MRLGAADVLGKEAFVKMDRDVDALHDLRRPTGKASAPGRIRGWCGRRAGGDLRHTPGWLFHGRRRTAALGETVMRAMQAILVLVVLCAAGLLGALFWPGASAPRYSGSTSPAEAKREAALGQFTPVDPPRPAPALGFTSPDGTP